MSGWCEVVVQTKSLRTRSADLLVDKKVCKVVGGERCVIVE